MPDTRDTAIHPQIPPASALDGWKVKNNSQPFDEEAALRYLSRSEDLFAKRLAGIIDTALASAESSKKL